MTKAPFEEVKRRSSLSGGADGESRPHDLALIRRVLFQLSYDGICAAVYIYEKLSAKTSPNLLSPTAARPSPALLFS